MSSHAFPIDPRVSTLERFAAITAALRAPDGVTQNAGSETYSFTPDLTAAEAATLQGLISDLTAAAHTRDLSLTVAEFQAIKSDLAALRAFLGVATPTAAQTAQAAKSIVRVLAALLRS